ncbi:fimbria A protein [Klebsiella pneumoniae]|nr:type 1 fimbrial protein [Klebsiella pneumoniae]VTN25810.1 fimbria A protein [Klebsiella pneumoniae]
MGLFNATLVMVSYLFISLFGVVLAKENSFILGRVNMQGAIIDTACTISFGNQKQTIDMGMLSLSELVRHGTSRSWFFSIKLTNCMSGYNKSDSLKKIQCYF